MLLNAFHNNLQGLTVVALKEGGEAIVVALTLPTETMISPLLFVKFVVSLDT